MKLSLGIPAYGRSYIVNSTQALDVSGEMNLYPINSGTPSGDRWDSAPGSHLFTARDIDPLKMRTKKSGVDQCGTMINRPGGTFTFWGLMEAGFLKPNGHPRKDIVSRYDECTQTVCAWMCLLKISC